MSKPPYIFDGQTKKNTKIQVRYPKIHDAEIMQHYINNLSKERTFIRFQGEQISIEDEKQYLESQLQQISQKTAVLLLAFCKDELIGIAGIDMMDKTDRHVGLFGISICKDFRGERVGSTLMQLVLSEAIKNLPQLEIITLCIFSNNLVGLEMYRKNGFIEYGRLPKGIKLESGYVDHILMYKPIKGLA